VFATDEGAQLLWQVVGLVLEAVHSAAASADGTRRTFDLGTVWRNWVTIWATPLRTAARSARTLVHEEFEPMSDVTSTVESVDCCIVGGGPGGAMLALLLARQGVRVKLLEAHSRFRARIPRRYDARLDATRTRADRPH
jgi:hypothetical protein